MWRATTGNSISFSKLKARPPLPEWPASFTAWTSRPSLPLSLQRSHLFLRTNIFLGQISSGHHRFESVRPAGCCPHRPIEFPLGLLLRILTPAKSTQMLTHPGSENCIKTKSCCGWWSRRLAPPTETLYFGGVYDATRNVETQSSLRSGWFGTHCADRDSASIQEGG